MFLILALHIKTRERRFCRHGRTHEEYLQFLKTNRNSLHFSIFLAVVMVRRLALSHKRTTTIPLVNLNPSEGSNDDNPERLFINREEEAKVIQLIATLPDAQQAVLRMKHIDGLETSEIARITGSSEEAVRQNLSRARKKILKMFTR